MRAQPLEVFGRFLVGFLSVFCQFLVSSWSFFGQFLFVFGRFFLSVFGRFLSFFGSVFDWFFVVFLSVFCRFFIVFLVVFFKDFSRTFFCILWRFFVVIRSLCFSVRTEGGDIKQVNFLYFNLFNFGEIRTISGDSTFLNFN